MMLRWMSLEGLFRFPKKPRLLVVDDEESLRITTAAIFENEGYIVDTASSGDEAIDSTEQSRLRPCAH